MTVTAYSLLAGGWIAWCFLHSLLISRTVSAYLQEGMGKYRYYYRLLYNLVALLSLFPLLMMTEAMRSQPVFSWQGGWVILRLVMFGLAVWLFFDGARNYDMQCMLGFRQITSRKQTVLLTEDEQFSRKGALGMTRHPWYLGGILIVWSRYPVYHDSTVLAVIILSLYFFVGIWLEERKLLAEYGEKYRSYQREVSVLLPWKWMLRKFSKEK